MRGHTGDVGLKVFPTVSIGPRKGGRQNCPCYHEQRGFYQHVNCFHKFYRFLYD